VIPDEARRLCRVTPLIYAGPLGCFLKLESLQATGSFKLRGAAVKLARLPPEVRARGVVAASAGNHGLGLSLAAQRLGMRATVIVSRGAAQVKRQGMARLGAEVIASAGDYSQAEREAIELARASGRAFVSPFDDDDVIDGNGAWLAEELASQQRELRRVIVPVGGGGLIAGLARALQPRGVQVIGVQPRANCAMHESFTQGRALVDYHGGPTACEGLEGAVAERTYAIAKQHVDSIVLVEEDEVLRAVAFAYRVLGLLVEPSAAVVLAAAQSGRVMAEDDTTLIVTGSNIDTEVLDRALAIG
jgi:threonine dehydratase